MIDPSRISEGKHLLVRMVQMLTKMIMAMGGNKVREDEVKYDAGAHEDFEHDYEHEQEHD